MDFCGLEIWYVYEHRYAINYCWQDEWECNIINYNVDIVHGFMNIYQINNRYKSVKKSQGNENTQNSFYVRYVYASRADHLIQAYRSYRHAYVYEIKHDTMTTCT